MRQEPMFERWSVGRARITRIVESVFRLPMQDLIPLADAQTINAHRSGLSTEQVDESGMMSLPMCGFAVESRGRVILVDTCIGPEHERGDTDSPFLRHLAEAGFSPEQVDTVVCTHLHFDHVGWNTTVVDGTRRPTFPNAEYLFAAAEWSAIRGVDRAGSLLLWSVDPDVGFLLEHDLATLVPSTHPITDEVSLIPTFGHSPGHVSIHIHSEGVQAVITGDAAHSPIQLVAPDLATTADDDPGRAALSRKALIERCVREEALVIGSHFATPAAVRLRPEDQTLCLEPVRPVS